MSDEDDFEDSVGSLSDELADAEDEEQPGRRPPMTLRAQTVTSSTSQMAMGRAKTARDATSMVPFPQPARGRLAERLSDHDLQIRRSRTSARTARAMARKRSSQTNLRRSAERKRSQDDVLADDGRPKPGRVQSAPPRDLKHSKSRGDDKKNNKKKKKRKSKKNELDDEHKGRRFSMTIGDIEVNVSPLHTDKDLEIQGRDLRFLNKSLKRGEQVMWSSMRTRNKSRRLMLQCVAPFLCLVLPVIVLWAEYSDQQWPVVLFVITMILWLGYTMHTFDQIQEARATFYAITNQRVIIGIGMYQGLCDSHMPALSVTSKLSRMKVAHVLRVEGHETRAECPCFEGGNETDAVLYKSDSKKTEDKKKKHGLMGVRNSEAVAKLLKDLVEMATEQHRTKNSRRSNRHQPRLDKPRMEM